MEGKINLIDRSKLHDVVFCKLNDSILEISRILRDTRKRHILVADEEHRPLGLISVFDINNRVVAEEKNPLELKAKDIMSSPVQTIDINSEFGETCQRMINLETYTMPVTENGKLIGILDLSTICKPSESGNLNKNKK